MSAGSLHTLTNIVASTVGYGLWKLDFRACRILRSLRHEMGIPYGFLLEFHGWWHVLTGLSGAAYLECIHILDRRESHGRRGMVVSKGGSSGEKGSLV